MRGGGGEAGGGRVYAYEVKGMEGRVYCEMHWLVCLSRRKRCPWAWALGLIRHPVVLHFSQPPMAGSGGQHRGKTQVLAMRYPFPAAKAQCIYILYYR